MASNLEEKFQKACNHVQALASNLESSKLLELYGLYKQATCGPCDTPQPSWFNMTAKRKWEAWLILGKVSKEEAMNKYILLVTTLDPDWEDDDATEKDAFSGSGWVAVSCPVIEPEDTLNDSDKTLLDWAKEGDIEKVKELAKDQDINQWDENGMTSLHWAADRGNTEMLQCLLSLGADVNFRDSEGQTALHFAASCGHVAAVKFLLSCSANCQLQDNEGDSPIDVASSQDISDLMKTVETT